MTEPAIRIKGLKKQYKNARTGEVKVALKGIDLNIPRGSFFGLLGPNGAGKSSLINIIADVSVKTSGKIYINGFDMDTDKQTAKKQIGIVPQEVQLDPFFPIGEMLEYQAGYYGVPKAKRRTKEILEKLALGDKAHLNSRRLSGGMKRRVLIAKALVHSPSVLILDEPTAGVDVDLRIRLWDYVRELNAAGTTVLLTTHYLEEAETLCDHIAIINHGEIIANEDKRTLIGRLDEKLLRLTFRQNVDQIPTALAAFDASIIAPNRIQIRYRNRDTSIGALLDAVSHTGLEIIDLSSEEPNLEDVFRHLTREVA